MYNIVKLFNAEHFQEGEKRKECANKMKPNVLLKRIIAVFLIIGFILPMAGNLVVRAESESNEEKYYHVNMSVLEHEPERCLVKESNGCFMVDLLWLCKNLDLNLVINDSLFETDIYKAKQVKNYYISQTKQGLEKTFADCKEKKKYTINKKNTDIKWTFSQSSDQGYAYSAYMGYIRINLGTSVECETINGYEYNWVSLVPFLSIFDSAHLCENNELIIMPCAETVFDILHNSRTGRLFYAVDENSGHGEVVTQIKLFYNTFYKKVKSFFKNAVSFHWIKAFKNMTLDHSPYAESLALELCRYNEEEMNEINLDCELRSEYACFLSDSIKELSELTSSGLDQKAQESARLLAELEKKLSATPYEYVSLKEYNEAMVKAAKTARDSKSFEPVHNAFTKASPVISVALAGAVEYITLSNEINSAQESSTDAVLTFLEYLDKESEVTLYTEIVDDLKKKAAMYDEKSTDFYENTAMSESIIEAVASEAGAQFLDSYSGEMISSVAIYKIFEGIGEELTSTTMLELKAISLLWEIGELVANKLSGEAFDELESFQLGFYTEMLEGDTSKVLSSFKNSMMLGYSDGMLDTYRQLEWVRLKSYYLARQNVMGSFKHYAKKSPEVYQTAFSEEMKDCKKLVHLMGILVSGNEGTTQKKLDECAKNYKSANVDLLFFAKSEKEREADNEYREKVFKKYLLDKYDSYRSQNAFYSFADINSDGKLEMIIRTYKNDYIYRVYKANNFNSLKNGSVKYDRVYDPDGHIENLEYNNILFLLYPPGTPLTDIPLVDYLGMTFGELEEIAGRKYLLSDEQWYGGSLVAYYEEDDIPLTFLREIDNINDYRIKSYHKIDCVEYYRTGKVDVNVNNQFSSKDNYKSLKKKIGHAAEYSPGEEVEGTCSYSLSYHDKENDIYIVFGWDKSPNGKDHPDYIRVA